jgi:hypothetical protein
MEDAMIRRVRMLLFALAIWLTSGELRADVTLFPGTDEQRVVSEKGAFVHSGIPGAKGASFFGEVSAQRTPDSLTITVTGALIQSGEGRVDTTNEDILFLTSTYDFGPKKTGGTLETGFDGWLTPLPALHPILRPGQPRQGDDPVVHPGAFFRTRAEASTFSPGHVQGTWAGPNAEPKKPQRVVVNKEVSHPFEEGTYVSGRGTLKGFITLRFGPNEEFRFETIKYNAMTPEPSTLLLLGIGSLGLIGFAWKRRSQAV